MPGNVIEGEMMHAKTTVSDGRYVRIGSTDFNPFGVTINVELDAIIDAPTLGATMDALFLEDRARSREITRVP